MAEPTAPGWYPDPDDGRRLRWWSGRGWADRWQDRQPSSGPPAEDRRRPLAPPLTPPSAPAWDAPIPLDLRGAPAGARGAVGPGSGAGGGPGRLPAAAQRQGGTMSFPAAVRDGFTRMFDWKGRSSRSAFWWLQLLSVGFTIASSAWDAYVLTAYPQWNDVEFFDPSIPGYIDLVSLLLLPAGLLVSVAVLGAGVRRMHDVGRAGWFVLVPFYNIFLAVQPSEPLPNRWG